MTDHSEPTAQPATTSAEAIIEAFSCAANGCHERYDRADVTDAINAIAQERDAARAALDETAQHLHYVQHLFTDGSPKHYTDCAVQPCQKNRAIKAQYDAKGSA
jgi:hypothetical protein